LRAREIIISLASITAENWQIRVEIKIISQWGRLDIHITVN
jgi:hypothetical protein